MSQGKYIIHSQGYYTANVQEGINSLLAGLSNNQRQLIIGLDSNNPKIKRHLFNFESSNQLTAYYTLKEELQDYTLLEKLCLKDSFETPYKCQFKHQKSLPLNSQGEVDKKELLIKIREENNQTIIEPRNETERKIASIWQELLNLPKISINSNFFELGGHSLLASQVISRLQDTFSVSLSLKNLLDAPTIVSLSQMVDVLDSLHNKTEIKTQQDYEEGEI